MRISEVRVKLIDDSTERLKAFCSMTLDHSFVIRDLKIIDGPHGVFVAMPSRKLTGHCDKCRAKNHLRAAYCNQCGARFYESRPGREEEGRVRLYADVAHPINARCRQVIQERLLRAYYEEIEKSKLPGYVCTYDGFLDDDGIDPESISAVPADSNEAQALVSEAPSRPPVNRPHASFGSPRESGGERHGPPCRQFGEGVFD